MSKLNQKGTPVISARYILFKSMQTFFKMSEKVLSVVSMSNVSKSFECIFQKDFSFCVN